LKKEYVPAPTIRATRYTDPISNITPAKIFLAIKTLFHCLGFKPTIKDPEAATLALRTTVPSPPNKAGAHNATAQPTADPIRLIAYICPAILEYVSSNKPIAIPLKKKGVARAM
jgi:hypothetical protein